MTRRRPTWPPRGLLRGSTRSAIERVWGKPLGDKAQLKIIRYQGTPNEREELLTVDLREQESGQDSVV